MHFTCMYNMYTKFGKFFMNGFLNYLQWQIFEEFSGCWKCIFNGENRVNLLPDFSGHFPVHSREMGFDAKKIWRIKNKKVLFYEYYLQYLYSKIHTTTMILTKNLNYLLKNLLRYRNKKINVFSSAFYTFMYLQVLWIHHCLKLSYNNLNGRWIPRENYI